MQHTLDLTHGKIGSIWFSPVRKTAFCLDQPCGNNVPLILLFQTHSKSVAPANSKTSLKITITVTHCPVHSVLCLIHYPHSQKKKRKEKNYKRPLVIDLACLCLTTSRESNVSGIPSRQCFRCKKQRERKIGRTRERGKNAFHK